MMTNMHSSVIISLDKNPDYWIFMREKPYWHRELSRHPEHFKEFLDDYKLIRRKRVVDRLEDFSMMMALARELM